MASASLPAAAKHPLGPRVGQSPPIDLAAPIPSISWLKDKTIVITGGANGLGEQFVRRWAVAGATIIIGDVNIKRGEAVAREACGAYGMNNVHFIPCDVRQWDQQVALFKAAVKYSPHGGIDAVCAGAGIVDSKREFEWPVGQGDEPPEKPPNLDAMDVNLTGVLYTCHLALFFLPRNPGSSPASSSCDPDTTQRDRHLLLIGSVASLSPIPGQALYGASKHAVLGLFRCLRSTCFQHGIRVSMLAPYFAPTSAKMVTPGARAILSRGSLAKVDDVVEAATRFMADPRVVGRALAIGPRFRVRWEADNEEYRLVVDAEDDGEEKALWEIFPDDLDDSDLFRKSISGESLQDSSIAPKVSKISK